MTTQLLSSRLRKRGRVQLILKIVVYNRKSESNIVFESSPAYATTEFKAKLVTALIENKNR